MKCVTWKHWIRIEWSAQFHWMLMSGISFFTYRQWHWHIDSDSPTYKNIQGCFTISTVNLSKAGHFVERCSKTFHTDSLSFFAMWAKYQIFAHLTLLGREMLPPTIKRQLQSLNLMKSSVFRLDISKAEKYISRCLEINRTTLFQIMYWRPFGAKPLFKAMLTTVSAPYGVSRPWLATNVDGM